MTNNIKQFRNAEKLTQKELAIKTGINERNLQAIEAGVLDPRTSNSMKIANALNTTVGELFPVGEETA